MAVKRQHRTNPDALFFIIGSGVVPFLKESYPKKKFHAASPWSDFEGLRPGAPGRIYHSHIDRTWLIPQNQTTCTEPNGYALEERVPHRCAPRNTLFFKDLNGYPNSKFRTPHSQFCIPNSLTSFQASYNRDGGVFGPNP